MTDDLTRLDATAQAELVRQRAVTPAELVEASIAAIKRVNPTLNAVISAFFDDGRRAAARQQRAEAPFPGVPFLLKDIGAMQAGQPYYAGNRALRDLDYRSPADTPLGARFRAAGLITLGKTNTPECGAQSTTQPLAFGATRNPFALDRSTGGSSGGSAAAVAAGLVAVAHANDAGGSIRIPAAWCGVVGLKPSRGRISGGPGFVRSAAAEFIVCRTVRDAARMLDAVHGPEAGDLFLAPPPRRRYVDELTAPHETLRIGILDRSPASAVHPDCARAVSETGKVLESLGHVVEPSWPEALFEPPPQSHARNLALMEGRGRIQMLADLLGRSVTKDDVEPYLWALSRPDQPPVPAEQYVSAQAWQHRWICRVVAWWQNGFDLLLTPTVCEPPARLADLTPSEGRPWDLGRKVLAHCALVQPFNITGQPAISLPLHWTTGGLPVGVQLVCAHGREDLLLRIAAEIERARPWADRWPPAYA